MAASNRSERQLMRQRGAGTRATKDVDFGLNFGPQGSREDRQLMRQRGAGNRKIDSINFGFSFPTPNNSRRSSSRLSQSSRKGVDRTSRPPSARKDRQSSTARSVRAESAESRELPRTQRSQSRTPQPVIQPEQPNSSKRRRLNKQTPVQISVDAIDSLLSPIQSTSNDDLPNAAELRERGETSQNRIPTTFQDGAPIVSGSHREESPLFFPESEDKENDAQDIHEAEHASKKRRSRIHHPTPSLQNPLVPIENDHPVQPSKAQGFEDASPTEDVEPTSDLDNLEVADSDIPVPAPTYSMVGINTKPSKKRKKRKSVILVKKKRRSSEMRREGSLQAAIESTSPVQDMRTNLPDEPAEDHSNASVANETTLDVSHGSISQLPKPIRASKSAMGRRSRLSVSTSPVPRAVGDEEEDDTYIDEENSPEPVTPAPSQGRKRSKKPTQRLSASTEKTHKERVAKSSYSIQTHRLVNAEALPTIAEEHEGASEDSGDESNQMPVTLSDRSQPNAVDVLAQVCRETIKNELDKLEATSAVSASRAELRRKRTALEAFASDLDQRLFDMSESVEHRLTLEARLRKSKRELAELQARWIEVRRQRDEVALKADAIRRQNWENEEDGKRRWEISELAHSTELELQRDVSDGDNLEFLLKEVATHVSSRHGRSGMLDKVKSLNGQLERLAVMLERR